MILAPPSDYPILTAEQELQLCSVGPPTPATPHGPGEWLRRMGRLPLMDQPGRQWRYNTSSLILGALVARAAGQPMDRFYRERIFGPLGMTDTGFTVPAGQLARLVPCYQQAGGKLVPFDDGGQWTRPQPFPDGGAGLVSTVGDYLAFGQMLLAGGRHQGRPFLAAELVAEMTADQLTAEQRGTAGPILDGRGWATGRPSSTHPQPSAPARRATAGTAASAPPGSTTRPRISSRGCAPRSSSCPAAARWRPTSGPLPTGRWRADRAGSPGPRRADPGTVRQDAREGFDDLRPAHGFAFSRLSAGGATITQLAEHLDITRQAAAQFVDELAAKGYVRRQPHPDDARARLITLTDKGWACTQAAEAAIAETVRGWATALSERQLHALASDLIRIAPHGPLRPVW